MTIATQCKPGRAAGSVHPQPGRNYPRYQVSWEAIASTKQARQVMSLAAMGSEMRGITTQSKQVDGGVLYTFHPTVSALSRQHAAQQIRSLLYDLNSSHGISAQVQRVELVRRTASPKAPGPRRKPLVSGHCVHIG